MDNQLQELIELQKEQNQLLRKHLTRIRFSLWALLILTTLTGVGLGIGVYMIRPVGRPLIAPPTPSAPPASPFRIQVQPMMPSPYQYETPPNKVERAPVG
jgi:hypothetical protein